MIKLFFRLKDKVINFLIFFFFQNIENFIKDVYKQRYEEDIQEEAVQLLYSIAVSIFAIGGMIGGFSGGIIANRFGRLVIIFFKCLY